MRLVLLLVLAGSAVFTALTASVPPWLSQAAPQSPVASFLPPDPEDWVCKDPNRKPATKAEIEAWCATHATPAERGEPLPPELRNPPPVADFKNYQDYSIALRGYLQTRQYAKWISDKEWRLSGPSVIPPNTYGQNYGTHFPLRVYYSPEVVEWLCNDRKGEIPDGAMIIKEMTLFSAGDFPLLKTHEDANSCMRLDPISTIGTPISPAIWAPMIKSSRSSHDGWVWMFQILDLGFGPPPQFPPPLSDASAFTKAIPANPSADDANWYPTGSMLENANKIPNVVMLNPLAGFASCLSCHATAQKQYTFASIDNILGKELRYKAFKTGQPLPPQDPSNLSPFPMPLKQPTPAFLSFFNQLDPVTFTDVWPLRMPAETYDQQVISAHDGPGQFLTAAQCDSCHNSTPQTPSLPNMVFIDDKPGRSSRLKNLSPYGEWRVSPMGLAGRDPVFFSQLQSETNNLPSLAACIENTCLHCHAVMGQRQLAIDTKDKNAACKDMFAVPPPAEVPFGTPFPRSALQQWPGSSPSDQQFYGALGRDGVSCTVCHHISEKKLGTESVTTGNFVTGKADEVFGPYKDDTIVKKPMENALGITPKFANQISKSELCGSCHDIILPVFDNSGGLLGARYEQSTHLEWLNSVSGRPGPQFRSCQDCHMPNRYKGQDLHFKIANSQNPDNFPPTTHRLPDKDITLTKRTEYSRHALHGLNAFLNQFFQQFPLILGFQQVDWSATQVSTLDPPAPQKFSNFVTELPLFTGFESMLDMARTQTATLDIGPVQKTAKGELRTTVTVTNLTGHALPTGVGFRRMFLQFLVLDKLGNTLWASGRTNELGFILDGVTDQVLESEQPVRFPNAPIQPHYQVISSEDQVQIYQELTRDAQNALTTSFLKRVTIAKDNRIRPKGFDPKFFAKSPSVYVRALAELPEGEAADPYYTNPRLTGAHKIEYKIPLDAAKLSSADRVEVTLYYQSLPPFYLQQRFRDASQGAGHKDDIRRLYYITSHLNLDEAESENHEAVLKGWKLQITSKAQQVQNPPGRPPKK